MYNIYIAHFLYGYNQMRFTTICGGLRQTAYLGANCSHTVHNFIHTIFTILYFDTPVPPDHNK